MTSTDLFLFVVLPYVAVGQLLPAILFYRRTDGPLAEPPGSPVLARERDGWTSRAAWAGAAALLLRRLRDARLSPLRTSLELAALAALLFASIAGVGTAILDRWGAAWYAHVLAPYLWSLARLRPDVEALASLGFWPRAHLGFAFLAMALVPFTTLPRQLARPAAALLRARPAAATGGAP